MRYLIIIIISIFITSTGFSNTVDPIAEKPIGSISGKVIDKDTKEPVSFATVALYKYNDTTKIIKGVVTDTDGIYTFSELPIGKYDIKVSYVGYNPIIIKEVKVDRSKSDLNLENIEMYENIAAISEVEIIQERIKGEEQIDKTVYTVNKQVRDASSSGLDMLKNIPAVSVDFQENVTLEGQSNILFYVDGIERNKDFIAQLDPKLIDKIEIISNPGVKYSADISGVINIVLIKEPRHGIHGSVKMDIPHPEIVLFNPRGNIEYGNQNFRTFIGARSHVEKFNGKTYYTKNINDISNPYYLEINGNGINKWANTTANYGFDWFVNDNTSLNFYSELRFHSGLEKDYVYKESTFINNTLNDYQVNKKQGDDKGFSSFYSLFYKKKMNEKGSELTLEGNYYNYNGLQEADFSYTEYNPQNISEEISFNDYIETIDNNRNNSKVKLDYTLVHDKIKQEMGYRFYYQWMNNDKLTAQKDFATYIFNEIESEQFSYDELRNIAYYSITGGIKDFTIQGGFRFENSIIGIPKKKDININLFLPQFKISYKINKTQSLKLSYRKQVNRPNIRDLNPFEIFVDSTTKRIGNPELRPAIKDGAEIVYSINFNNNYISPKLYYNYSKNNIAQNSIIQDDITYIYQDNIMDRYQIGIALYGAIQLQKWWRINFYLSSFERIIKNQGTQENKISHRAYINNIFMLPKDFSIYAWISYNSPYIEYQRVHSRDILFMTGIEKKISKKAKLSAFYNPFIKDFTYQRVKTTYGNNYEDWRGSLSIQHAFTIEFTYNFSYGKKVNKIKRSTEYEQDGSGGMM